MQWQVRQDHEWLRMKKFLTDALIISVVAVAMALLTNGLRTNRLPLLSAAGPAQATAVDQDVRQISIDTAEAKFNQNTALFADARPAADFAAGHIAGAVNLPAAASEQWLGRLFASTDPEQTLITYCAGPKCNLGKQLARILTEAGFEQVFYLVDGWGQWTSRDLPIEKGE
jgi:rhodanese-related sulfurtransferase